jgi:Protein kinase domain
MESCGGQASLLGRSLGGHQVRALIGRGAMGAVYLAQDVALSRPVALKVLLGTLSRAPSMVQRFHREAQTAAPLRHPNIVRIYSAGIEDGVPFIAMEYVPGEPFDRFLRRRGQLTWQAALYVGEQVAEALAYAHRNSVVHRDVKPANMLLDRQGRIRLADFGIAGVTKGGAGGIAGGQMVGTPHYMSPEQCAGAPVDSRTDLYSLGVTLFEMMAGHVPFDGPSHVALIERITAGDAPRLNRLIPGIPDDVARLVAHLLERTPQGRPSDAAWVVQRIKQLQREEGGRSAMPEALSAFLREHAQIPPLQSITPPPEGRRSERTPANGVFAAGGIGQLLRGGILRAVAAVVVVAVVSGGLAWALRAAGVGARDTGRIDAFTFVEVGPNELVGRLPAEGYRFTEVAWTRDSSTVVLRARGRDGTLTHGAGGLLAVEPERRTCTSLRAPSGPLIDPNHGQAEEEDRSSALPAMTFRDDNALHPSGQYRIVSQAEKGRGTQLWAVERQAPYRRQRLTSLPEGVPGNCTVSPDGRWGAALVDEAGDPGVVFVDLTGVTFQGTT